MSGEKYRQYMFLLLLLSFIVRAFCAGMIEFGNDEVYYRLYALFPDWSHFDHPGMVGWIIQLFTFNLFFDSELAIRMASLVLGTADTWLIWLIGKQIAGERAGWFSALLYTSSVYASVLVGTFILPDTPLLFFWLLSMLFFLRAFSEEMHSGRNMLLAGLFCGLAFLSKYTAAFLWSGAGLYILFRDRRWLRRKELYLSALITLLLTLPVWIWNLQNDFISFTFHSERVVAEQTLRPDFFGREIAGEFFYNNPLLFIFIVTACVSFFRSFRQQAASAQGRSVFYLMLTALPLILVFWMVSLTRATLPHWSGPAFVTLIPAAALHLDRRIPAGVFFPRRIMAALWLISAVLILALAEIRTGFLPLDSHTERDRMGRNDFTLDMYGWEQFGEQFREAHPDDRDPIFSFRWFPAAHLDYYVAAPAGVDLFCLGPLEKIHKYSWINADRGGLQEGMDGWFVTTSRDFQDPARLYAPDSEYSDYYFEKTGPSETFVIRRGGKAVYNFYVYRMENLKYKGNDQ